MYRLSKNAVKKQQTSGLECSDETLMFLEKHSTRLKRSARKYSLCSADADDVWQRAIEIFITHAPSTKGPTRLAWMHTVVKHEAFAVKRHRMRMLGGVDGDFDSSDLVCDQPGPEDQLQLIERISRADAALQLLKDAEAKCLILKAQGYSYDEVAEITGFSWTKVNRSISEGRRSFLQRFISIEEGDECRSHRHDLEAIAKDKHSKPTPKVLAHLRCCDTCRAVLRHMRGSSRPKINQIERTASLS